VNMQGGDTVDNSCGRGQADSAKQRRYNGHTWWGD
jgi:hypothetical protein